MIIKASVLTNKGTRRKCNEDNFYFQGHYLTKPQENMDKVLTQTVDTKQLALFSVFDGLGSISGGDIASHASARYTDERFSDYQKSKVKETPDIFMKDVCMQMNQLVNQMAESMIADFGTTVSSLLFYDDQVLICNVGDSPIYLYRGGRLMRLYEEHITFSYSKPVLAQCIGMPTDLQTLSPYINYQYLLPGDQFLICSDGLTKMLSEKEITDIVSSSDIQENKIKEMMTLTLNNGGRDNITIILIES